MSHTLINCTCKNRLGFALLPLLWYHSMLRGSIDEKHAKTNEIWRQNSEIHSAFACFHRPPWLPDPFKPYGACVKRGSRKHMFGPSLFVQVGSQISPRRAKKDSNIPSPGRTTSVKCPTPGTIKTIKSPPHTRKVKESPAHEMVLSTQALHTMTLVCSASLLLSLND